MTDQSIFGHVMDRRRLFASTAVLGAAALLSSVARAQSGEIVVSNWGGDWSERIAKGFEEPAFAASAMRIIHDLAPCRYACSRAVRRGPIPCLGRPPRLRPSPSPCGTIRLVRTATTPDKGGHRERAMEPIHQAMHEVQAGIDYAVRKFGD